MNKSYSKLLYDASVTQIIRDVHTGRFKICPLSFCYHSARFSEAEFFWPRLRRQITLIMLSGTKISWMWKK